MAVVEHLLAVHRQVGKGARSVAAGDDDVVGGDLLGAAIVPGQRQRGRIEEGRRAHQDRDLVLLHQEFDALGVLRDDTVFALHHLRKIERGLVDGDAFIARMGGEVPHVGGVEQGLGRNTADMKAGAAQFGVFFDNGRFQAVLSGADGGRVAARATYTSCERTF